MDKRRGRKRKLPLPLLPIESQIQPPETPDQSQAPESSVLRDASGGLLAADQSIPSFGMDASDNLPTDDSRMPPPDLPPATPLPISGGAAIGSPDPNMLASPNANLPELSPAYVSSLGNRTPADLQHGEGAGGMTPLNLAFGGSTPMQLPGGMTPGYAGDFSTADLPAYNTPTYPGGITPHHGIMENLESIPNLPADQVSSILNGTGMDNIGYSNMGYDDAAPQATPRGAGGMSERVTNDWNDDYDFPPSVGAHVSHFFFIDIFFKFNLFFFVAQQPGDEQMENETDEQFEERVLNKRAAQMFLAVRARMQKSEQIYLSEMTVKNNRKQVCFKYYIW